MLRKTARFIYRSMIHVALLLRNAPSWSEGFAVLATYTRITFNDLVRVRWLGQKRDRERFLGNAVSLVDYHSFRELFIEMFAIREYTFESGAAPFIVDCGSNIGISVMFFKRLFPSCSIRCFEPNPAVFRCLERNVAENGFRDVELHEAAVAFEEGTATLYATDQDNLEASLVATMQPGRAVSESTVRCVRLSDSIDRPVQMLKLDIQGAEGEVVEDLAERGKLDLIQNVVIEYHDDRVNPRNRLACMLSRLEHAGFRFVIHSVHHPPYTRHARKPACFLIYAYRG